ncbi:hypothetical protein F5H01DRAFT_353848 [Linnemannia elongata]|nr:hypothetical protein F5H01DRAFT_353848 [Linnemannia elongata]
MLIIEVVSGRFFALLLVSMSEPQLATAENSPAVDSASMAPSLVIMDWPRPITTRPSLTSKVFTASFLDSRATSDSFC